jgi:hypothetical protein
LFLLTLLLFLFTEHLKLEESELKGNLGRKMWITVGYYSILRFAMSPFGLPFGAIRKCTGNPGPGM